MRSRAIHLPAGADLRRSLEHLAQESADPGFVLSVVGNMSQARFACPGRREPTLLSGELEIISLQGTISPGGVHLHLSFSDATCQVWGGHLESGSLVLKGADLLLGFPDHNPLVGEVSQPRLSIALAEGCPWSARAVRMLRTLGVPFDLAAPAQGGDLPHLFLDGQLIGGYRELAEMHASGQLQQLRHG